jgi:hypothetical protein
MLLAACGPDLDGSGVSLEFDEDMDKPYKSVLLVIPHDAERQIDWRVNRLTELPDQH